MNKVQLKQQQWGDKIVSKAATVMPLSYDPTTNIIHCKVAGYGNKDCDGDILVYGCANDSIIASENGRAHKILALYQHDRKDPVGMPINLKEKQDGLYCDILMSDPESVPSSKRVIAQVKDGVINQMSIGFRYIWDLCEHDSVQDALIVKGIDLLEVSFVTFGANMRTSAIYAEAPKKSFLSKLSIK